MVQASARGGHRRKGRKSPSPSPSPSRRDSGRLALAAGAPARHDDVVDGAVRADDKLERLGLRVVAMSPRFAPALDRFHERLSPATTRNRFFSLHPHLSAGEVKRFTEVDHEDREALVALDADGE